MQARLVVLLWAVVCFGQATKVELTGTVTGPDGGVVRGVAVTVVNEGTRVEQQVVTGEAGEFTVLALPPGSYTLRVKKEGFAVYERREVALRVGDLVEMELRLRLAEQGMQVEVSAEAPLPQTSRGTVSFVVDQKKVVTLPLDGRNFVPLIALSPGVNLLPGNVFPRINGSRPRVIEYIYDGISVLQPEPGQVAYYPVIDAIDEFRVEANSYSAEYGRSNGGVILVNQKAGTNEWHGTLFEFFRNEKLNARNLFATTGAKPVFRRNQYGLVVGGPVKKNQTFVFGDWQGTRQAVGVVRTSTVPTVAERAGQFRTAVYDPLTTRRVDGVWQRDVFAGNVVPLTRVDRVTAGVVGRYPLPDTTATANNYRRVGNERVGADQWDARVDHYFSGRQRLFGRYAYLRDRSTPTTPLPDGSGVVASGFIGDTLTRADSVAVDWSVNVSAASVNQLRFGYTRRGFERSSIRGSGGFYDVAPTYDVVGYQQLGPTASSNAEFSTSVTQLIDNYSVVRGAHSLKMGMDLRWEHLNVLQPPSPAGNYQFTNVFTAGLTGAGAVVGGTGNAYASFLLGQVGRYSLDAQPEKLQPRARIAEFFLQDDWRATRRLTVNAGVRYTLNFPSTVNGGKTAVFDLKEQVLRYGGTARELEKLNFAPRLGLAYKLREGMMLRAGYGLTWIEQAGITTPFTTPLFPFIQTVGQQTLDNINPAFVLASGATVRPVATDANAGLGQGVFGTQRNNGSGYAQQWNATVSRTIGRDWNVEVGYLGSKLTRLGVPDVNLNQLTVEQLALGTQLTQQVANPYAGQLPGALGAAKVARGQLLRPYPRFTAVTLYRNNTGHSTYHSAQARVEKRFAKRLTMSAAYTFSRLIDDAGAVFDSAVLTGPVTNYQAADSFNKRLEKDVSTGNVPHIFAGSFVYELPWGLQMGGIVRRQSGSPIAVTQATNLNAFAGFGIQRPNRVAAPELAESERSLGRWFNTAAFAQAGQFTIGNSSRNPVVGPRYSTVDLMVGKTFRVGERMRVEVRAEAFNLTNTPPLGNPNGSFGAAAFGTITTALDPRVYEFVCKLHF